MHKHGVARTIFKWCESTDVLQIAWLEARASQRDLLAGFSRTPQFRNGSTMEHLQKYYWSTNFLLASSTNVDNASAPDNRGIASRQRAMEDETQQALPAFRSPSGMYAPQCMCLGGREVLFIPLPLPLPPSSSSSNNNNNDYNSQTMPPLSLLKCPSRPLQLN